MSAFDPGRFAGHGVVIPSVLEPDAAAAAEAIAAADRRCPLVELRADLLEGAAVERVVRGAGRPLIVAARRPADGGRFTGTEAERRDLLLRALDAGAVLVDVEADGGLADLVDGAAKGRAILSRHLDEDAPVALERAYGEMARSSAAILKIVPHASGTATGIHGVRSLLDRARGDGKRLICFASGIRGAATRIFALSWGSWAVYAAPRRDSETAEGQWSVADLLNLYRVTSLGPRSRRFALVGSSVLDSPSPAMHAAGFRWAGLDAVYVPLRSASASELIPLVGPKGLLRLEGLAVTVPLKEEVAALCRPGDRIARESGAVNTVICRDRTWTGYNTDGPAILELVRARLDPRGAQVAVVGAGGTARAAAVVLRGTGARVTLFNRDRRRAEGAASRLGVKAAALETLPGAEWDVLVQATPLGRKGERVLPPDRLRGRMVLDAAYGPRPTPLTKDARSRGLAVADGVDLLVEQGVRQFRILTGVEADGSLFRRACLRRLEGGAA